ncbi:unnamed protein product [Calypogeia fissa]
MKIPTNTLGTVRSTVLVVVLLVVAFILFDSHNWQLLSVSWSHQSFNPSHPKSESSAAPTTAPISSAPAARTEDSSTELAKSERFSVGDDFGYDFDESEIANDEHLPKNDSIPGDLVTQTEETFIPDEGLLDGYHAANTTSESQRSGNSGAVSFSQENDEPRGGSMNSGTVTIDSGQAGAQEFAKMQNLTTLESHDASSVDSRLRTDRLKAELEEGASNVEAVPPRVPPFENAPDSEERSGPELDTGTTPVPLTSSSDSKAPPKAADQVPKQQNTRTFDELSNIEKVEFDLWQARSAMRRVILAQMNSSNAEPQSVPDGEPQGDVYRNAAIFRQGYQEMEERFKVYIYQEGEEPLVHNGPCKNIYAIEGRFIQELQGDNPFVTEDPEEAHVFFLPFSVAMMVTYLYTANSGDMSPLLRFAKDYIDVVSRKYPYWTRSEGTDHFMLACHDWGPHISRADEKLVSKTIRVLCNANVSEGYIPTKDASLPEIHLIGGETPAELGGLPASERTILAFFAGGDHGPVRPDLFKHWEGKDDGILVYHQVPDGGPAYHTYMKSSKYCLCPGGYEVNSPRIVEAIYNDCVPVVIADKFVLPFSDVLDWKTFALHVLEADIPNLKLILEAVPMEIYLGMEARIRQVRHHFLLNQPPKRYDAFNMILHSVWLRRLNIQLLPPGQT